MSLWLAILLAVVVGWAFGKKVVVKDGRKFSWLAFFVIFFLLLGGFEFIFGLAIGVAVIGLIITILFWPAALIALIYCLVKLVQKSKQRNPPPVEPEEPPSEPTPPPPKP